MCRLQEIFECKHENDNHDFKIYFGKLNRVTCPAAFSAFIASRRLGYFLAATAPRIAAPKSTDSFSLGRMIEQPEDHEF